MRMRRGLASDTHCREFLIFQSGNLHFLLLIQNMAEVFSFATPFTGFLWPILHEEEGGAKHSTGEFKCGILCVEWEDMDIRIRVGIGIGQKYPHVARKAVSFVFR